MKKEEWLKLADAYIREMDYFSKLDVARKKLANEHGISTDFIGNDYFWGPLSDVVSEMLGDEFVFWYTECEQSFDDYNRRITEADGTHPNVHTLEELYEYSHK